MAWMNYVSNLNCKAKITRTLLLLLGSFSIAYLTVLHFSHKQDISVFVAIFSTLLTVFILANQYLDNLRSADIDTSVDTEEQLSTKREVEKVTAQKVELARDKRRLQYVLDISREGLWEWNLRTGEVVFNSECKEILGIGDNPDYSFEDFEESIIEEDKARVGQAINALVERNEPYDMEFRIKRPDGGIIWIWDRCGVVEYDNNEPIWMIGIVQDITEAKRNQAKINHLAYYDSMTNLPNRVLLQKKLQEVIQDDSPERLYSALLFLDLDKFKLLNDTYGHQMGDRLLVEVAQRLANEVGRKGTVARFGGDEFVVILPHLSNASKLARAYAQRLSDCLCHVVSEPVNLSDGDIELDYSITTSIGGIVFNSSESSEENLLRLADLALHRAKGASGHGVKVFAPESRIDLDRTSVLQKAVHQAFSDNEFCLYLQPKYSATHKLIGAESVMRWLHPTMGVLAPRAFLDIVEDTNLILPMGNQALNRACEVLSQWCNEPGSENLTISVNLSSKQIWYSNFVSEFASILNKYQIDRTKLILEVSEAIFLKDIEEAIDKLNEIKALGVKLSLGNFGTGYSSLSCLLKLPVDEIKIDRSIIKNIFIDEQAYQMVNSIIAMAANFQLDVVAEGVETTAQLELLKKHDNCLFQGYYFDMPMSVEKFNNLVGHV